MPTTTTSMTLLPLPLNSHATHSFVSWLMTFSLSLAPAWNISTENETKEKDHCLCCGVRVDRGDHAKTIPFKYHQN